MSIRTTLITTTAAVISSLSIGCGKKAAGDVSTNLTVKFQSIDSTAGIASLTQSDQHLPLVAQPYTSQRSLTPSSFKFPIKRITVQGNNVGQTIYECAGTTADDCLVDLADAAAVSKLITDPISITYKEDTAPTINQFSVTVNPACETGGGTSSFNAQVKGSISVGDTTYYTTSSDGTKVLTTDSSKAGYAKVPMSTCTMTWPIATDVAIDSGKIVVSLFVTVKDVAYANTASLTSTPSCTSDSTGAGNFVCAGLAVPYPYIGSGTPTISSFKVTQSNGYLGKVHVAMLEGQPVGAFLRPYFDGTNEGDIDCKTGSWLKSFTKNSDGTYRIKIAADGSTDFDMYEAFKLESHSGSCKNSGGTSFSYTATKLE